MFLYIDLIPIVSLNSSAAPEHPVRRAYSMEPVQERRKKKFYEEVEGYKEPPDFLPRFEFQLRDRYIIEGVGVKLLCSVEAKPKPEVVVKYWSYWDI